MKIFHKIYYWLYRFIKGHLPIGTLVSFRPVPNEDYNFWYRPHKFRILVDSPERGTIGIVIGGWRSFISPGIDVMGSTAMFNGVSYDIYDRHLEIIDGDM